MFNITSFVCHRFSCCFSLLRWSLRKLSCSSFQFNDKIDLRARCSVMVFWRGPLPGPHSMGPGPVPGPGPGLGPGPGPKEFKKQFLNFIFFTSKKRFFSIGSKAEKHVCRNRFIEDCSLARWLFFVCVYYMNMGTFGIIVLGKNFLM